MTDILHDLSSRRPSVARPSSRADLAEKLVTMRKRAGLTQTELADRLGWKQNQVSLIEKFDGPDPDRARVAAYAAACGATASAWHFRFEGAPDMVVAL